MRPQQRQLYAERIDRVVRHLQTLDWSSNPATDLNSLAAVGGLSPFHFHRVFRLMTGESVGEMVRRLRLARTLGGFDVAKASVTEAAMAAGYATPQAFARAMRGVAGCSPSELLRSPDLAAVLRAKLARRAEGKDANSSPPLSIEITSIEPFTVQALRNVGRYEDLDQAYERLFAVILAELPPTSLRGIYGVPLDDPRSVAANDCRFDCAVRVDGAVALPAPVRALILGGGAYVIARHVGSYDLIHAAIDELVDALLDCDEVSLRDAPIHVLYHDEPEQRPAGELRADIHIPIAWERASG